ncbi:unnamed protein product [Effrenium voratum]|nr:unnamed protein product [Effrenium voratum]
MTWLKKLTELEDDGLTGVRVQALRRFAAEPASGKEGPVHWQQSMGRITLTCPLVQGNLKEEDLVVQASTCQLQVLVQNKPVEGLNGTLCGSLLPKLCYFRLQRVASRRMTRGVDEAFQRATLVLELAKGAHKSWPQLRRGGFGSVPPLKRFRSFPMSGLLRWGICGAGKISRDFALGLLQNGGLEKGSRVHGVASRGGHGAREFVAKFANCGHQIGRSFNSYEEMFADPELDVVYVGTVHPTHYQVALAGIRAGKHVLVEKPLCTTLAETRDLVAEARKAGVFLMEGLWTRCFPATLRVKELLESNRFGPVRAVSADFGFYLPFDASHRLHAKETGGGAMLNLGFYPVQWAVFAFGGRIPDRIVAAGRLSPAGVDLQGGATLVWNGKDGSGSEPGTSAGVASLTFGFCCNTGETAEIICERGSLRVETPAHAPIKLRIVDRSADPLARPGAGSYEEEVVEFPLEELPYHSWAEPQPGFSYPHGEGMMYEARHVEECLARGLLESPLYPLDETLVVAQIMDECVRQLTQRPA